MVHRLLDVQDFSAEREDGLENAVTALLRSTASGVTLYQEEFAQTGVLFGAIRQLARETGAAHDSLALDHLAGFSGRVTRLGCEDDLLYDGLGVVRVLFEVVGQHIADRLGDRLRDFLVAQFGLGLSLELGLHDLDAHDGSQSLTEVVPTDFKLELVQHA